MKRNLSQFKDQTFDVLIIGGGINGCGVARDAARRGLSVALVEKTDFSNGTSCTSTKLAHGGVRYLENYEFRLVWEACHERRRLLDLAPHLVRPQSFILPLYKGDSRPPWMINIGMWLYDLMAAFKNVKRHCMLSVKQTLEKEPKLNAAGLRGAAVYYDAQLNDSRLCLENVLEAAEHGAQVANHIECTSLQQKDGIWQAGLRDTLNGEKLSVKASTVLNLGGPWVDKICAMIADDIPRKVRTTKGVHLLTEERLTGDNALLLFTRADNRVYFVIPWLTGSMVGTTDTDFTDSPDHVVTDKADAAYLLEETKRVFPQAKLTAEHVVTSFAGLRPLVFEPGKSESAVSREHVISEDAPGFLTMAGGKLTTYRAMAEELTDRVIKKLKLKNSKACDTKKTPLYGGALNNTIEAYINERIPGLKNIMPEETAAALINHLGTKHEEIATLIRENGELGARICGQHQHLLAEVDYAVKVEMALTLRDFMCCRSWICFAPCRGLDCAPKTAERMAALLNWSPERKEQELNTYREWIEANHAF